MTFGSALRQEEPRGDLLVRQPFRDERRDLQLARGQDRGGGHVGIVRPAWSIPWSLGVWRTRTPLGTGCVLPTFSADVPTTTMRPALRGKEDRSNAVSEIRAGRAGFRTLDRRGGAHGRRDRRLCVPRDLGPAGTGSGERRRD